MVTTANLSFEKFAEVTNLARAILNGMEDNNDFEYYVRPKFKTIDISLIPTLIEECWNQTPAENSYLTASQYAAGRLLL